MFPDLLPSSAWGRNLRSLLPRPAWDRLRRWAYARAGGVCEHCAQTGHEQGRRHALEAHEIWDVCADARTVTLAGIVALCPLCHAVAHLGRTLTQGRRAFVRAVTHMQHVHGLDDVQTEAVVSHAFAQWQAYGDTPFTVTVAEGLAALIAEGAPLTEEDVEGCP